MEIKMVTDALADIWPMMTIFLVVIISVRLMYIHNSSEKFVFYKEFFNILFVIYALLLFSLLTKSELNVNSGYNLVPFTEITRYKFGTTGFNLNVIGNILIFVPFGYFISTYIRAKKISHIFLVTFITSLTVEFVQHYIGRSFDVDDILLNIVGSIIGFLLYVGFEAIKKHLPSVLKSDLIYNILCLLLCAIVIIYYLSVFGIK